MEVSAATVFRLLNNPPKVIHPSTQRKLQKATGYTYEELISTDIGIINKHNNEHRVSFIDLDEGISPEFLYSDIEYLFAVRIKDHRFKPLFPKGSILYFESDSAYQNDICILKSNKSYDLYKVMTSYRTELTLQSLSTKRQITIRRDKIIGILSSSLNP